MFNEFAANTLDLYLDAAPWLVLGLLAAGLLKAWVPEERLSRWLGGSGPWTVARAAVIGAPLPLCSCGVVPAALGLRRGGASRPATVAFLIATPETGVDSIALSYALLGPFMAVVRPLAALVTAISTGLLVALNGERDTPRSLPVVAAACGCGASGGCSGDAPTAGRRGGVGAGVRYAFGEILDDISLWLVGGLLLAGLTTTLLPPQALGAWGGGLPAMLVMLAVGIPMYICATASTPLAAALMAAGLSPGATLVFLLAGPATNLATLGIVARELGRRTALLYLTGIALTSLAAGLLTDRLVTLFPVAATSHATTPLPLWLSGGCALLLAAMALPPLRRRLPGMA